jgi:uncharacterized protein
MAHPPGNRLIGTTSPYLQQHAYNPVAWWPWCEEALELACREDRPILLSIGYSACHWCHVMAHESFEDPETAALMNRLFVNIKVDREERPDLDRIYQTAHQLLARGPGGWPLTMFLTPQDRVPFFGGTYFPPRPRHGLPTFRDLLIQVEAAYRRQGDAIREQNRALVATLAKLDGGPEGGDEGLPDDGPLAQATRQMAASFDSCNGGFGRAPKFPHCPSLEFLLRRWSAGALQGTGDPQALHMAAYSLERMILGGINDQLGGGFCRYSVDDRWLIPHFEKMLYDNGPLLALCCDAWQATGRALFRDAAVATADWVIREMQGPEGGYYSSLDADSDGEEGRYYLWERDQVYALLGAEDYALVGDRYGLDGPASFKGRWHLHVCRDLAGLGESQGLDEAQAGARLAQACRTLLAARAERTLPARDEKVLTSWNGLMIKGMVRAGRVLGRRDYMDSAERALGLIRGALWRDGRLLATYKDGQVHLMGYLDDYAYLLDALLELLQARWSRPDLDLSIALAETLLAHFAAPAGGFYFTADDHECLIHRPKPLGDDSMPAGNGVAALALLRLGHLVGESRYLEAAEGTLRAAWPQLLKYPQGHASLLMALEEWISPGETLVIRAEALRLAAWRAAIPLGLAPHRLVLAIPDEELGLPGLLAECGVRRGGVAYLCSGTRCGAPLLSPEALRLALVGSTARATG